MIEKVIAGTAQPSPVRVCIDIDTSYVALGGRLRIGAAAVGAGWRGHGANVLGLTGWARD